MPIETNILIIGSGPAAWSAAIYAARADLNPVVITGDQIGGQLMNTGEVENYPGFKDGISGPKLMTEMQSQAEKFKTIVIPESVKSIQNQTSPFLITLNNHQTILAKSVILTTGAQAKWTGIDGESKFMGKGVSACAVCDAAFFRNKSTAVVGGGDAAMEDAMALTKFASKVTLIHRRDEFKASKIMIDRVLNNPKISIMYSHAPLEILGENYVTGIKLKNLKDNSESILDVDGVFIAIGHSPSTSWLPDEIKRDSHGYIITRQVYSNESLTAAIDGIGTKALLDYPTMTSTIGIFAAGDCVDLRYKQAVVAAGMGVMAALDAQWWLENNNI